jgi:hypothetical protein
VGLVSKLYAAEKRAIVPPESAARAMGYTSLSGRARVKISTLRKYGLLDEAKGRFRVSDLAMRIMFERSPEDKQAAIDDAAMRPEVFRQLLANGEASDMTLANELVQRGYSVDGAKTAVASFRETMKVVGSPSIQYDDLESEDEPMMESQSVATSGSTGPGVFPRRPPQDSRPITPAADYLWQLPGGVKVEMRLSGGPLTKAGLSLMREYLEILEKVLPESMQDSEPILPRGLASAPGQPSERSPDDAPD